MKKSLFTAIAVGLGLTASLFAQVPSYVPTNGLVGWWPFNGNANDESGNGNNGTVNGATLTADRFGNAGTAYNFDGNADFISVQNSNSLSPQNLTMNIWFNISSNYVNGNLCLLSKMNHSSANYFDYSMGLDSLTYKKSAGYSTIGCSSSTGVGGDGTKKSIFTQKGIWYMITATISNSGFIKLFLNGSLFHQYQGLNLIPCNNILSELRFAHWWNGDNQWFFGKLDDIGIWNRALSECEIADLYNSQLGSFSNSSVSINPSLSSLGSNATLTVTTPIQNIQWQSNPSNIGWVNLSDNSNYNGVNNDTLVVSNLQLSNHNQPFRVLACGDTSNIATIQIADTCITNVTVYDTLLTTVTDTLIINTTLSLPAPNNENTILIYPNPASDHITIDNGNFAAMAGYSIKIKNNAGQQVFQSAINQAQFYVDLSTWTGNGLYFVHLIDPQNNMVTVRKIVLQ